MFCVFTFHMLHMMQLILNLYANKFFLLLSYQYKFFSYEPRIFELIKNKPELDLVDIKKIAYIIHTINELHD